jgi:hypothetical protein
MLGSRREHDQTETIGLQEVMVFVGAVHQEAGIMGEGCRVGGGDKEGGVNVGDSNATRLDSTGRVFDGESKGIRPDSDRWVVGGDGVRWC